MNINSKSGSIDDSENEALSNSRSSPLREARVKRSSTPENEKSEDHESSSEKHSQSINQKELTPPLSPKSVEPEESLDAKKPVKSKKGRKQQQDEETVRAGVEDLLTKISAAIEEDRESVLRKQAGRLISVKEAISPSGNRKQAQKHLLR
jgi:hypothetical protein